MARIYHRKRDATSDEPVSEDNRLPVDVLEITRQVDDPQHKNDPGVILLAVRKATPANLSGADGDYEMLQTSAGRLWVSSTLGDAILGTDDVALTPTTGLITGALADMTAPDPVDEGDFGVLAMSLYRALKIMVTRSSDGAEYKAGTGFPVTLDTALVETTDIVSALNRVNTATLANVADSATSVTLQASNTARKGWACFNDSTEILYIKFGATASTTSFVAAVPASGLYEMPMPIYTGIIDGIWAANASGSARVTEYTQV